MELKLARMGPDYAAGPMLIERFQRADLSYARRATVWSVGPADEETDDGAHALEVGLSLGGIVRPIAAHRVILVTGALERPFSFPGWTIPGVMAASRLSAVLIGRFIERPASVQSSSTRSTAATEQT